VDAAVRRDVGLVAVPVAAGAAGVSAFGAAGDDDVTAARLLEADQALDRAPADLLERRAGGDVPVGAAAGRAPADAVRAQDVRGETVLHPPRLGNVLRQRGRRVPGGGVPGGGIAGGGGGVRRGGGRRRSGVVRPGIRRVRGRGRRGARRRGVPGGQQRRPVLVPAGTRTGEDRSQYRRGRGGAGEDGLHRCGSPRRSLLGGGRACGGGGERGGRGREARQQRRRP